MKLYLYKSFFILQRFSHQWIKMFFKVIWFNGTFSITWEVLLAITHWFLSSRNIYLYNAYIYTYILLYIFVLRKKTYSYFHTLEKYNILNDIFVKWKK